MAPSKGPDCLSLEQLEQFAVAATRDVSAELQDHLRQCPECAGQLEAMRAANAFLGRFASEADSRPDTPSSQIHVPGYDVEELLAVGGQGAVYRARQRGLGRMVAIKVPLGDSTRQPAVRYRFEREIELTATLDHPGIVRVFGACELADGRLGYVMEYIEGEFIDRWAAGGGKRRRPVEDVVRMIADVADAIAFAHQRAVIHRDIKPGNVIVTAEGVARVLDFGIAKTVDHQEHSFVTHTGAFIGTLAYAAPEQVTGQREATDLRTDVYALGMLLFHALTGRLPFPTDVPPHEAINLIRDMPPPKPSTIVDGVRDDLDAVVLKALAKEKDRRYASAAEFRDDLRAWLEGRPVQAKLDSRWYVIRTTARRHRWAITSLAAGILVVMVIGILAVIAREQAHHARMSRAVRDARILESHWVKLEEARFVARDNFEAGERTAWDALLDPDHVLIEAGVEGVGEGGPLAASPAYWALCEMYLRTPVLFTAPTQSRFQFGFDNDADDLVVFDQKTGCLHVWDWRGSAVRREISLPSVDPYHAAHIMFGKAAITWRDQQAIVVDLASGKTRSVDGTARTGARLMAEDRLAITRILEAGISAVEVWNIEPDEPVLLARHRMTGDLNSFAMDVHGDYAAFVTRRGDVLVVDVRSGQALFRRGWDEEPRFYGVCSRGKRGEIILWGPKQVAVLNLDSSFSEAIERSFTKTGFVQDSREMAGAVDSDRYVQIDDRFRIGVGDTQHPVTSGHFLPALTAYAAQLSPTGRTAAIVRHPSSHGAVLDLQASGVRRLPFAAPVTSDGFATIFDVAFIDEGRTLVAGAMDGSVRRFDVALGEPLPGPRVTIPGGVTNLLADGDHVVAGSHDQGLHNARVVRIGDGTIQSLIPGGQRYISGLAGDAEDLWVLAGKGRVFRLHGTEIVAETQIDLHYLMPSVREMIRLRAHKVLLVGPAENGIVILDEETLLPAATTIKMPPIRVMVQSPADPDLIATAAEDGKIHVWRFHPGPEARLEAVRSFGTHAGALFDIAFSPDGRLIASAGGVPESRDVRLWDLESGQELAAFDLFELGVFCLSFSPDGRYLAAGGEVRIDRPEEGGELYLIDLEAPNVSIAGNLEFHIARFEEEHGREPSQAAALRAWAETIRAASSD